jgi:hypothetical protein
VGEVGKVGTTDVVGGGMGVFSVLEVDVEVIVVRVLESFERIELIIADWFCSRVVVCCRVVVVCCRVVVCCKRICWRVVRLSACCSWLVCRVSILVFASAINASAASIFELVVMDNWSKDEQ